MLEKNIRVCKHFRKFPLLVKLTRTLSQRDPPPAAEWWDVELLPNKTYDDLDLGMDKLKIRTDDSPIGIYIQHPIAIPAPWDKDAIALKPLKLTKKVHLIGAFCFPIEIN